MPLTPTQKVTFKAAMLADPVIGPLLTDPERPPNPDTDDFIARYYNQPSETPFFVWRSAVTRAEIMQNGFNWTRVDNASVGKARIWEWLFLDGPINPSKPNIRDGINEAWTGTAVELQAHRLAIFGHCQKQATRAERLFAGAGGTTTTNAGVGPATTALTEPLTPSDVEAARNLP